jgi:hypothetical protein
LHFEWGAEMDENLPAYSDTELSEIAEADYKSLIDGHIHRANKGDVTSGTAILAEFCAQVEKTDKDGNQYLDNNAESYDIDPRIIRYLYGCFQHTLAGVKVDRALNLEKPANRPPDPKQKQKDVALAVEAERAGYGKAKNKRGQLQILEKIGGADKDRDGNFKNGRSQSKIKAAFKKHEIAAAVIVKLESLDKPR